MLYQLDLSGVAAPSVIERYWEVTEAPPEVRRYADSVVSGVAAHLPAIDERIAAHSTNWKISRMAAVDKNILRLAVYELTLCPDIPVKVTINEAVEIAKRFGSAESGAFVNGILDNIARDIVKTAEDEGGAGE